MSIATKGKKAVLLGSNWFRDIWRSRRLILDLANKDFKGRYAASYLGTIWAFVQPIVTILIYVFVFQLGMKATPPEGAGDIPYSLWLTIGIVPWFFFQDALMSATNSLMEFSYLVKKIVFKISVLPIVKIISAFYVHIFFAFLLVVLSAIFGYMPHIYMLQAVYYTGAATVLVLGLSYITASTVVFFRDLSQIISILLQFGMWLTPIMWNMGTMGIENELVQRMFKLNPMYYIVNGYRDSFINKVWFWEHQGWTIYFWMVTLGVCALGTLTFKKLEKHFADVL